ncbi:MAG: polysaccharide deacetylase family protein [Tissierellaceae bacterium]|jgi:probable sporulation protein (polysaccharide deacetylase family)|nr:polysaccharide deacetylase family protein [Tissierellia bacterium]
MRFIILGRKTLISILVVALVLIILLVGFLRLNRAKEVFNKDIYYQGSREEKIVAFACNIDWGNEYIGDMLDIFHDNKIKISFFPTGRWAEENRDLLLKIYRAGHEIGNHGYSHLDYDKLDYDGNYKEIAKAHKVIEGIIDESPKYFAPPSGAYNEFTIQAARNLGYKTILWSIDTIDWREDSHKDLIVSRVIEKIHKSAIVLMHPTDETRKALPEIINKLYEMGYKIGRISDII